MGRIMGDAPLVAVLAAGLGSRFGGGKLDADCAGKPLGQWVLDATAAAGLAPGMMVVGPNAPAFAATSEWELLTNPKPEAGLGGSVAIAAAAALAQSRGLLLLLADMPLVAPYYLQSLAGQKVSTATLHPDRRAGVPALLTLASLPQATRLHGERGAGPLLASLAGLVLLDPPAAMLLDVDRPEDLAEVARLLGGGLSQA